MALPADRNSGESTAGFAPRLVPTPFLTKTYQLVDDHAIDNVISWNADGSTFIVWNPTEFARDLLPKYFKHNNFSSFVRQLSTYGFSKIVQDRWEFSNECFRRGQKNLLCDIQRRKIAAPPSTVLPAPSASPLTVSPSDSGEEQVFPSSISQPAIHKLRGSTAELIGENKMLREKNAQLNKELSHMKNLCNHIYLLMSNCTNINNSNRNDGYQDHSCKLFSAETAAKPLDLLPMTRFCEEIAAANCGEGSMIRSAAEEISARVFGVPIGPERGRESEVTSAMDLQLQLPGGDIKYEPLDEDERVDNQEPSLTRAKWRNLCN